MAPAAQERPRQEESDLCGGIEYALDAMATILLSGLMWGLR